MSAPGGQLPSLSRDDLPWAWAMAANMDGRPRPAAYIRDFDHFTLHVRCEACGRAAALRFRQVRMRGRSRLRFCELQERLRCRRGPDACGGGGAITDVSGWDIPYHLWRLRQHEQ